MKASSSVMVDAAILPTRINMLETKLKTLSDEARPWVPAATSRQSW